MRGFALGPTQYLLALLTVVHPQGLWCERAASADLSPPDRCPVKPTLREFTMHAERERHLTRPSESSAPTSSLCCTRPDAHNGDQWRRCAVLYAKVAKINHWHWPYS
ncbi:hypothetical protein BC628DRAFT_1015049 [Trametes gibbosa]|nr:hypothetical protein BC628DRAFT_1015049 [Trametes gibbosa]